MYVKIKVQQLQAKILSRISGYLYPLDNNTTSQLALVLLLSLGSSPEYDTSIVVFTHMWPQTYSYYIV